MDTLKGREAEVEDTAPYWKEKAEPAMTQVLLW